MNLFFDTTEENRSEADYFFRQL